MEQKSVEQFWKELDTQDNAARWILQMELSHEKRIPVVDLEQLFALELSLSENGPAFNLSNINETIKEVFHTPEQLRNYLTEHNLPVPEYYDRAWFNMTLEYKAKQEKKGIVKL